MDNAAKELATSTAYLLLSVASFSLSAFVLQLDWNWFVTKLGAPRANYGTMFGLSILLAFVSYSGEKVIMSDEERLALSHYNLKHAMVYTVFILLLSLLTHWVVG